MSLASGDLTTPQRAAIWLPGTTTLPSAILSQLITSMSTMIYGKLNRSRLYSQQFIRTFSGVGVPQIILPDWPVTNITKVQIGGSLATFVPLPQIAAGGSTFGFGFGYRCVLWDNFLPGNPSVIDLINGSFCPGLQNVQVTYTAGYFVDKEPGTIPGTGPYTVTVTQGQGIWCRDGGVTYTDGTPFTPVTTLTGAGQYIIPTDALPGQYTFDAADANADVLISYSFIPADLEEACNQMVGERLSYRGRIGEISKSLGGQETIRFSRGPLARYQNNSLPPEVWDLIQPYVSTIPTLLGSPQ